MRVSTKIFILIVYAALNMKFMQRLFVAACFAAVFSADASGYTAQSLRGRVVDCDTQLPIAGAVVSIGASVVVTETDEDGKFAFLDLDAGSYHIRVEAPAYHNSNNFMAYVNDGIPIYYNLCLKPIHYIAETQKVSADRGRSEAGLVVLDRNSEAFQSSRSLSQVIERIPGLIVSDGGSGGGESTVSVMGGPSKEVLVLVDGVSINSPVTGTADVNSIPLSAVSRLEFRKGGSSSEFGSGAVGGVLAILTSTDVVDSGAGVNGSVGNLSSNRWGSSISLDAGRTLLQASVEGETSANTFPYDNMKGDAVERENADVKRLEASLHGQSRIRQTSIGMGYLRFGEEGGLPGFIFQLTPHARRHESRDILTVRSETPLYGSRLLVDYAFRGYDQEYVDTLHHFPSHNSYRDRLHQMSFTLSRLEIARTEIGVSVTGQHESFSISNLLSARTQTDRVIDRRISWRTSALRPQILGGDLRRASAVFRVDVRGDYSNLNGPIHSRSAFSGITLTNWATLSFEGTYGTSFRSPLYTSLFWNDGVFAVGNANLKPERTEESSAGVRLSMPIAGDLSVEWRYQHAAKTDLIVWQRFLDRWYTPVNLSGALIFTKSIIVKWDIERLKLCIEYANTDQISKDRSQDISHRNRQLTYRPRFVQDLSVSHSGKYVYGSFRLRHVSRRFIRAANTKSLDPYTLMDASVSLKLPTRWCTARIGFEMINLGDTDYFLVERYPLAGRHWAASAGIDVPLAVK